MNHAIKRTNPKGEPFVGKCYQCGEENLPIEAVTWSCENTANLTAAESILIAVKGEANEV
jgi:hypothetical protein